MVTGLSYEAVVHEPNRLNLNVLVDDPCTMPGSPILGTAYPITMLTMSSCTLVTCVAVFLFLVFRQCRAHRRFNRTWSKRTVNVYSPTTFRNKRPNLSVSTNSLADTYRTVKHKPSSSSTLYDISEEPTTPLDHTPTTPCLQSPSPPYTPLGRISLLESPTMACFAGPISFCPSQRSETGFLPLKA
ncbi:hypothetical protein BD310DRAFT_831002 [Dichomitus squalens]|uniref:Uncharacterized protein n=1 Tax=Dichomitus squalens TaxID=114155 RepID=A0A4Q9PHA2_9APHY|nr:hypothetical protein BD310DRAFT_831002 [Dichomitus squalens]